MWFHFGNSSEGSALNSQESFHRESTQRICSRPALADLDAGFLTCGSCGAEMDMGTIQPLSLGRCPACAAPSFFPLRIKDYWLYEPLGGGGMGSVYHAFSRSNPDMDFAVKVLPRKKKEDPFLVQSLLAEAKVGHAMGDHPHLVRTYEYGHAGGEYYAVFEFIDGVRLDQLIDSPVRRPEKQVLLWALQILAAEQHMYSAGYLFRDLKPQNIIVNQEGNVKLIDFGLALPVREALENPSDQIKGSPYYLPPERIVGAGESMCSEIYSLGMVVFHALARQTYYSADDIKKLISKHVFSLRITDVTTKLPSQMNRELIKVLNRMIQRDPKRRYQSYKEAAADLFRIYKQSA